MIHTVYILQDGAKNRHRYLIRVSQITHSDISFLLISINATDTISTPLLLSRFTASVYENVSDGFNGAFVIEPVRPTAYLFSL